MVIDSNRWYQMVVVIEIDAVLGRSWTSIDVRLGTRHAYNARKSREQSLLGRSSGVSHASPKGHLSESSWQKTRDWEFQSSAHSHHSKSDFPIKDTVWKSACDQVVFSWIHFEGCREKEECVKRMRMGVEWHFGNSREEHHTYSHTTSLLRVTPERSADHAQQEPSISKVFPEELTHEMSPIVFCSNKSHLKECFIDYLGKSYHWRCLGKFIRHLLLRNSFGCYFGWLALPKPFQSFAHSPETQR